MFTVKNTPPEAIFVASYGTEPSNSAPLRFRPCGSMVFVGLEASRTMGGEQGQEAKGQRLDVGGWKKKYDGSWQLANVVAKNQRPKAEKVKSEK
ncbi:MAG: hypothetical protein RG741_04540 [Bacteroidales bacterium]|nr:hypothetical protein [Bacteroidales bacterium]